MEGLPDRNLLSASSALSARDAAPTGDCNQAPLRSMTDAQLTASLLLLIAALWVATRPYPGIVQDARLYMVQALRELHPARFAQDLYFQFGSQDRFTVFSKFYAPLVSILGVSAAGILLTIIGQILWIGGLLYLALGSIRPRLHALFAVAAVVAMPSNYGFFEYGEPFATPRLFAEALTMLALGLLVRRRNGWALATLVISAAIHPLMTLPGLTIAFVYLAVGRPLWWAAIAGGVMAAAGLAMAGVQPFANLRITLDPQWFDVVKVRDWFCFITRWSVDGDLRVLGTIALAVLALALAEPRERRLLGCALIVGIGGLACTLIGADLFRNVLITEIQQYRSMWPLMIIANLCVVPLFVQLLRRGDIVDLVKLGYIITISILVLSHFIPRVILSAAPMMIVTSIFTLWQCRTGHRLPLIARGFFLSSLALGSAVAILYAIWFEDFVEAWPDEFWRQIYSLALVIAALIIFILIIQAMHTERERQRLGRLLLWLAAALLPAALFGWDARTPWTRFVESSGPVPTSLAALLPQDASVYWEGSVRMLWLRLQRPSYFSCSQGTGALFFRGTALIYRHRAESFWPLRTLDFDRNAQCPNLDKTGKPRRTRADLQQVCRHEPGLDYLVLTRPIANVASKVWDSPVSYQDVRVVSGKLTVQETTRFYVYSCAVVG